MALFTATPQSRVFFLNEFNQIPKITNPPDPWKQFGQHHHTDPKAPNKKNTKKSESDLLAEFGIVGQLAEDFIAHRKSKRAAITKTVLVGYQREAHKAGIPLAEAITISIERNWQGFKAGWNWCDDNIATATNTRKTSAFADDGSWAVGRKLNIDPELIPEELR